MSSGLTKENGFNPKTGIYVEKNKEIYILFMLGPGGKLRRLFYTCGGVTEVISLIQGPTHYGNIASTGIYKKLQEMYSIIVPSEQCG